MLEFSIACAILRLHSGHDAWVEDHSELGPAQHDLCFTAAAEMWLLCEDTGMNGHHSRKQRTNKLQFEALSQTPKQ